MKTPTICTLGLALILGAANQAGAQTTTGVPPAIWTQIQALGPVVDQVGVRKIYAQLRSQMPADGVKKTLNISYGPADAQKLDLYEPATPVSKAPVLIFVHGGAFIGGSKGTYDNIGYYMARHGVIAVLPDYRLAPANPWPAGAQDVGAAVAWTRANAAAHGGDPNRIVLFGHSAGASHVAAYAFEKRFQPASGSGLAGVILGSGLYDPSIEGPGPANTPYYGPDPKTYAARSTALHADAAKIPTLIFEVELDPLPMVIENGSFYTQLCHRDNQCPVMYRFLQYDHISAPVAINTGDETISAPLLDFIRAR
ncbi:MAG TPA: alpha/beta hydrolase [Candidatus Lustribacter sp.]|jgi:triacylglycerol lipase|nr:alpha/beta hydrolase [Candidatus Lustribacter sp.]